MGAAGRAWTRYRARKSRKGVAIDFALLAVAVVLAVGPLRRGVMTYALRCLIAQPRAYDAIAYVGPCDNIVAMTPCGVDTTLRFPAGHAVALNSASVWSAQSRAEMRSLNAAAAKWRGMAFYVLTDAEEMADMARYMARKRYTSLRLVGLKESLCGMSLADDETCGRSGVIGELESSVPATVVLDADGQVVVKKFGAAKWEGRRIDKIFRQISGNKDNSQTKSEHSNH